MACLDGEISFVSGSGFQFAGHAGLLLYSENRIHGSRLLAGDMLPGVVLPLDILECPPNGAVTLQSR